MKITLNNTTHTIHVNDLGFLDLSNHVSDKKHIISGLSLAGKPGYFKKGKDKRQEFFDEEGKDTKVVKVKSSQSAWSPFYIEKKNGQRGGPFTWHHVEDGTTLQSVLKEVHDKFRGKHTGGNSMAHSHESLIGFFAD